MLAQRYLSPFHLKMNRLTKIVWIHCRFSLLQSPLAHAQRRALPLASDGRGRKQYPETPTPAWSAQEPLESRVNPETRRDQRRAHFAAAANNPIL